MKKLVYIAHPIGGDVLRNLGKVCEIVRSFREKNETPFVPYFVFLQALVDDIPEDRVLAFGWNRQLFERKSFDELWLYGDKVSSGMQQEIQWAFEFGIPLVPKSDAATIWLATYQPKLFI